MITFTEYILDKIESAILCDDKDTYTIQDIHNLVNSSIEDYEHEYNTTISNLSNIPFTKIKQLLNQMNIKLV
ncbi:hypothetical protein [Metabacillus arenae]|uniref:Uncharacterized protein n=1 Tax=Metabacillus arenae TaxID=2771434 RepID=A0A926NJU8_9BACI|nr:hypothetical protein [Metabacillus arenae]MBD1379176.1 hypothetical protein [Metabacillus arenae]